jgi:hypothetical protein
MKLMIGTPLFGKSPLKRKPIIDSYNKLGGQFVRRHQSILLGTD